MEFEVKAERQDYMELRKSLFLLQERRSIFRRHPVAWMVLLTVLSFLLAVLVRVAPFKAFTVLNTPFQVLTIVCLAFCFVLWLGYWLNVRAGAKQYETDSKNGDLEATVTLNDEGIAVRSNNGSSALFYRWDMVARLAVTQNLFAFVTQGNIILFFGKRFVPMPQEEFMRFLEPYVQGKPVIYGDR